MLDSATRKTRDTRLADTSTASGPKSQVANAGLAELLDRYTAESPLLEVEGNRLRCLACGHRCLIAPGRRGICKVRFNQNGQLRVPFGYVAGLACDPIEKKPFFHVYPGSNALTFGMLGCNFHCDFCQNWVTSQALRDAASGAAVKPITADQIVAAAHLNGAKLVVSSYNEPLITAEWAAEIFRQAKSQGMLCAMVSNGNATAEVLDFLAPWMAACKVDLKCFDDRHYRSLGGTLKTVTESIRLAHQRKLWVEVVTLLIPGFNDSEEELRAMTEFIVSVSPDIPWHVTAFHQDYKLAKSGYTTVRDLLQAAQIGKQAGLRFVYAGNLPGQVDGWEDTKCPQCNEMLIERSGFWVRSYRLTPNAKCPKCQCQIPGIWPNETKN